MPLDTYFAVFLRSDTDLGLMYTRSARRLLSGMLFAVLLRFDTAFGLMYTRSARFLPSDTHYAVFLRSDTDFGLMYGRCSRLWLSGHVLLGFCFWTDMSL